MVASIKECAFIATILPSCFSVKLASAWTFPSSKLLKSPCTHRRFLHHYDESSLLTQGQCYPSRRIDVHQFNCRSKLSRATGRGAKGVVPATFMSTTSLHLSIASSSQEDHNDVSSTTVLGAMGLNELQTLLRESVKIEDYPRAAKIRDAIADKLSSASSSSSSLVNPNEADEEPLRGGTSATGDGNGDAVVMKQRPSRRQRRHLSWKGLGTAPWLVERLEALGYNMPTTIQINAFESINSMLLRDVKVVSGVRNGGGGNSSISSFASSSDVGGRAEEPSATLEELITERDRLISNSIIADTKLSNDISHHDKENEITRASNKNEGNNENNMAVIVSGSTGSGKTLAYAVPMLSTLSESLFRRQRIRVKAEEDITDATNDLLSRVAVTTSPEVRGQGRKQVGGIRNDSSRGDDTGSTNFIHGYSDDETGIKSATLGKSGNDVKSPMALIVVPTRELGVQTAMNVYELIGGSTRRASPIDYFGGSKANMFKVSDTLPHDGFLMFLVPNRRPIFAIFLERCSVVTISLFGRITRYFCC